MTAAKHICTQKHMPPSFPAPLLMLLPDPLALLLLLPQKTLHPPVNTSSPSCWSCPCCWSSLHCLPGTSSGKKKKKTTTLVLQRLTRLTSPTLPLPSPNGSEPDSEAELRVTNTSSFSHWGGALSGSTASWLPFMLSEKRTGCDSGRTQATESQRVQKKFSTTFGIEHCLSKTSANEKE